MTFFKKLEICEFFIEIEKYYGEYPENKRALVFGFTSNLTDYERAALYNELIEHYPSGFGAPDVYRLNLHFKNAKKTMQKELILSGFKEDKEEDAEESGNLADVLPEMATQYGLDPQDKHLFTKILLCKMRETKQGAVKEE